jgi:hypothetical protein
MKREEQVDRNSEHSLILHSNVEVDDDDDDDDDDTFPKSAGDKTTNAVIVRIRRRGSSGSGMDSDMRCFVLDTLHEILTD